MKSIVCEEPFKFKMTDIEPPTRGEGEALIDIRRIGICGTDLHAYQGNQPFFSYPRVLGHELSGVITEIGDNPEGLKAGDEVVIAPYLACGKCIACRDGKTNCCTALSLIGVHQDGGMCETISMPTGQLLKADGLSLEQMATVECLGIGAHAVRRAQIQPGEFTLVIGAGPIGIGAMHFARIAGADVIAMDINDQRLAYCQHKLGVKHTINALNDPHGQLKKITDGDYPTKVLEATGSPKSMQAAFEYVAHGGSYILIGFAKADITFHDPEFHKRETSLLASRNATIDDMKNVIKALADGEIETDTFITHRVPFDDMLDHFESWLKPETQVIKAMVEL